MDNKIQEKLHALFVNYTENLPIKLRTLQTDWDNLETHWEIGAFADFHRAVHSLCGSSGTYGYTILSQRLRETEIYLKALLTRSEEPSSEQKAIIRNLLERVTAVVLMPETETFMTTAKPINQSKFIYLLDAHRDSFPELKTELQQTDYQLLHIKDFPELLRLCSDTTPAAMIVHTDFLGINETLALRALQNKNEIIAPLFCISEQGDLKTRLRATRAGSLAFMQKPIDAFYLAKMLDERRNTLATEPFRILIIDDSASLAEYYALLLQDAGMITRTLSKPLEVIETLLEFQPNLLLLDLYMPECSGIELAVALRQESNFTHIPIIFLSSEDDKFKQLDALSLGGDDFLTKPILPQHLIAAVKSRATRAGILNTYMTRDSLTGLLNHSNILHQLETELIRAERYNTPLTFAMLDLDHFKRINDQYGHLMGDRVLRKLSETLISRLRKTDFVGRYGGEEFAIILSNTNASTAQKILEQLLQNFSKIVFGQPNMHFTVTFSAGAVDSTQHKDAEALIEATDQMLYKAKQNGRSRVEAG